MAQSRHFTWSQCWTEIITYTNHHPHLFIWQSHVVVFSFSILHLKITSYLNRCVILSLSLSSPLTLQIKALQKQRRDGCKLFNGEGKKHCFLSNLNSAETFCQFFHLFFYVVSFPRHTCRARQRVLPNAILLYVLLLCHPDDDSPAVLKRLWLNVNPGPSRPSGKLNYAPVYVWSLFVFLVFLLFVYKVSSVKTVSVAVDVSTTAENVVHYIKQECKLLVSHPSNCHSVAVRSFRAKTEKENQSI